MDDRRLGKRWTDQVKIKCAFLHLVSQIAVALRHISVAYPYLGNPRPPKNHPNNHPNHHYNHHDRDYRPISVHKQPLPEWGIVPGS